ncbi:MAG: serine phosphatase RsbU (regulator of sigma subunit) [Arenicella sp.]|jgi:serine phosphatase RsbU (regulator of sigma subunit)
MKQLLKLITLSFLLFTFSPILAQNQGKTFVQNYPPKVYKGQAQNWSLVQDYRGIIYVGNGGGVMEYDGSNWRTLTLPGSATARSLGVTPNKVVYVGTSVGFGFLSIDDNGNTIYKPLQTQLPDSVQEKMTDIWEVIPIGDEVFFRSSYYLFRYKNGKVDYWEPYEGCRFFSGFAFNGKYHAFESKRGHRKVKIVENDSLVEVSEVEKFARRLVSVVIPYKADTIILGGGRGNFYKYPFSKNHKADSLGLFANLNANANIYRFGTDGIPFEDGYAFGTRSKGIVTFDKKFQFKKNIRQENNGLISNQIYQAILDRDGALWCATGNGLAKVDLSSDISYWDKSVGLAGTIYHLERFKNQLYINTSLSVFTLKDSKIIQLENAPEAQCWHLLKFKNPEKEGEEILLMSTRSLWEIEGEKIKTVLTSPYTTGAIFYMLQDIATPKRVWFAMSTGVGSAVYEKEKWTVEPMIEEFSENSRDIRHDGKGGFWIATFRSGVYHLIKKEGEREFEIEKFTETEGLISNSNPNLGEISGDFVVGTSKGFNIYDESQKRFKPYEKLGKEFSEVPRDVYRFQEDLLGDVWVSGEFTINQPVIVARREAGNSYKLDNSPFKKVPPMGVESFLVDEKGTAWLGGTEGLFRYKAEQKDRSAELEYHAIIRKVVIGKDSTLFGGNYSKQLNDSMRVATLTAITSSQLPIVPAGMHSIDFYFTSPFFDNESETQYKYYLEGFDDSWSDWEKRGEKEYTNLWGKEYTFHVKAKNLYGVESSEAVYKFRVQNPWYFRWWAFVLYGLLALLIIRLAVKWNSKRLERENERLEGVIEERTKEIRAKTDSLTLKNTELNQQKEEISAQAENLRELNEEISTVNSDLNTKTGALEKANKNIENLTSIGQVITSTLKLSEVTRIVYETVNEIMDASGFGIGVYRPSENSLDFRGYMEKGKKLPDHNEAITEDASTLAVEVFNSGETFFSNNLEMDFADKSKSFEILQGEVPLSVIYMPLVYQGEKVGVLTVQSFEKFAYHNEHLELIKGLASYISIALANARGYEIIRANNKSIKDSIRYSKTIQQSFLPSTAQLNQYLGDYFLLYQPKDIVSGDFYWFAYSEETKQTFVAVVDCTGHGVPGSFVSIVGATILNEIVNLYKIYEPAAILEKLNKEVISTLHQGGTSATNDDGMDVCLCVLEDGEAGNKKISFSGAKRDLYFIKENSSELSVLQGDKKHIGGMHLKDKPFTNQTIELSTGDILYLTSDGLVDQHNMNRKKYGTLAFKKLLIEMANLPTQRQAEILYATLERHKGEMKQRDDITILGIRIE